MLRGENLSNKAANAAPLGLAGFALTTFAFSLHNAGLTELLSFWPWAIFYGGIAQFAAGMWEFKRGSTFPATAFSSYGAFWMGLASLVSLFNWGLLTEAAFASAETTLLIGWSIFTFYMWIGTFKMNWALVTTFTALLATFLILTVKALTGIPILTTIGGWVGIITALCAWYVSAAELIEESWGEEALPLGSI
ncbi:MAG: acetate uptake transporter [Hadesarchaea archaeon]|nr:acetate uptake transporter [Hadesarchaea archaeon]